MEYLDVLKARSTTFSWKADQVPVEIIREVCEEVYNYAPSKNRKIPYVVDIIDNTDPEQRKKIHTMCHRNTDHNMMIDKGNPQVLAPTLLAFSTRDVVYEETIFQTIEQRPGIGIANTDNIEIGIAAVSFINGFTARGIDTGLCQCIRDAEAMAKLIGADRRTNLFIGVGYRETHPLYIDPRTNRSRRIPYAYGENPYPRPAFEDVYKIKVK
jgi:hypothetical protein